MKKTFWGPSVWALGQIFLMSLQVILMRGRVSEAMLHQTDRADAADFRFIPNGDFQTS